MRIIGEDGNFCFGKYRDQPFDIEIDSGYIWWIREMGFGHDDERFQELTRDMEEPCPIVYFGKYKGKTLIQLKNENSRYYDWVRTKSCLRNNIKVQSYIEKHMPDAA